MKLHAELTYDERSDLLTGTVSEAGEVARELETDGLLLGLTSAGVVAEFSIEDFGSFARFDVLYVFGGGSLVRALSEFQFGVEDGVAPSKLIVEFDPPQRAKRERDAKVLERGDRPFSWVS